MHIYGMKNFTLVPARLASTFLVLVILASNFPAHAQPNPTKLICRAESQVTNFWNEDGTYERGSSYSADDVYIFSLSYSEITYISASKSLNDLLSQKGGAYAKEVLELKGKERACTCSNKSCNYEIGEIKKGTGPHVFIRCGISNFAFDPKNLFFLETVQLPDFVTATTKGGSCTKL